MTSIGKTGLPVHDSVVDALTPKPIRGAATDRGTLILAALLVALIAVCIAAVVIP